VFCRSRSPHLSRRLVVPGELRRGLHAFTACLLAITTVPTLFCGEPPVAAITEPAATAPATPPVPTVIESGSAEMVSTEKETTFRFSNGVTVTATNMKLTCDYLEVVARRSGDPAATIGKQEDFKSLIATGAVRIVQSDREATCERAEVFPDEDRVVLTGNPIVRSLDGQYQASGPKMVLHRGERRAQIIGEAGERPRISLPPLKDLGYEKELPRKKTGQPAPPASGPNEPAAPVITVPITPRPQ
jgi:lipopolysaccharide export system protein LptA